MHFQHMAAEVYSGFNAITMPSQGRKEQRLPLVIQFYHLRPADASTKTLFEKGFLKKKVQGAVFRQRIVFACDIKCHQFCFGY